MKDLALNVWFPHFFFFLYTVGHSYPEFPNKTSKRKYYDFIQNLPLFIPHGDQRKVFSRLLDGLPVSPYLDNRDSFLFWLHLMHNQWKTELGLEVRTYHQHLDSYYTEYIPKTLSFSEKFRIQRKYLTLVVIFVCLAMIVLFR